MPEGYQKARPYPGQHYRLKDAADSNQLTIFGEYGLVAPAVAATALLIGVFLIWSGGVD